VGITLEGRSAGDKGQGEGRDDGSGESHFDEEVRECVCVKCVEEDEEVVGGESK
jgi:hypothetical protein